jgi:hypothetical protein
LTLESRRESREGTGSAFECLGVNRERYTMGEKKAGPLLNRPGRFQVLLHSAHPVKSMVTVSLPSVTEVSNGGKGGENGSTMFT